MQYLITLKGIDNAIAGPPNVIVPVIENMILPTLKKLAELERDKKLTGGSFAGQREIAFVMDFPSNDEAGKFVMGLPWWPIHNCEVIPLQPIQTHVAFAEQSLKQMKAMMK